jgi:hypothetical protein
LGTWGAGCEELGDIENSESFRVAVIDGRIEYKLVTRSSFIELVMPYRKNLLMSEHGSRIHSLT